MKAIEVPETLLDLFDRQAKEVSELHGAILDYERAQRAVRHQLVATDLGSESSEHRVSLSAQVQHCAKSFEALLKKKKEIEDLTILIALELQRHTVANE